MDRRFQARIVQKQGSFHRGRLWGLPVLEPEEFIYHAHRPCFCRKHAVTPVYRLPLRGRRRDLFPACDLPMSVWTTANETRFFCMQQAFQLSDRTSGRSDTPGLERLVTFLSARKTRILFISTATNRRGDPSTWITLVYALLVIPWVATLLLGIAGLPAAKTGEIQSRVCRICFSAWVCPAKFIYHCGAEVHMAWIPCLCLFAAMDGTRSKINPDSVFERQKPLLIISLMVIFILRMVRDGKIPAFSHTGLWRKRVLLSY